MEDFYYTEVTIIILPDTVVTCLRIKPGAQGFCRT